jgi:hypothetical protein
VTLAATRAHLAITGYSKGDSAARSNNNGHSGQPYEKKRKTRVDVLTPRG